MELHSEVSHQVWVFNAFKYFQLICRLLDCFVIVWLETDLVGKRQTTFTNTCRSTDYLKTLLINVAYLLHGHQFTGVHVNAGVHLPILALTCCTHKHYIIVCVSDT